jgi:outer membrane protein TolC
MAFCWTLLGFGAAAPAWAASAPLALEAALRRGRQQQPALAGARAQTAAASGQAWQMRAALLPSLLGSANYQRTTANFVPRPGYVVGSPRQSTAPLIYSNASDNFWSLALGASWLVYDFNASIDSFRAASAAVEAMGRNERQVALSVDYNVRVAFFTAGAKGALVQVSQQALANQRKHCGQIEAYIDAGTHPTIDLARVRTDVANAKVALLAAENDYATAKLALNGAMGVLGDVQYDVVAQQMEPVDEGHTEAEWLAEAQANRPDLQTLQLSKRAAELRAEAAFGNHFPSLSLGANLSDQGSQLHHLGWNWNVQGTLSWSLFSGGLRWGQQRAAEANVAAAQSQIDSLNLQIRVDVQQALFSLGSGLASLEASAEALRNAAALLDAAEGRYAVGIGSIIELGDAQISKTTAAAQQVQALYQLSTARASLLKAAGRV